jgi:hypothetical protein
VSAAAGTGQADAAAKAVPAEAVPAKAVPAKAVPAETGDNSALSMSGRVTVVPGIARYHRNQCILIRFLGDGDLETMTREAAEAAKLIACKACQPDKEVSDF